MGGFAPIPPNAPPGTPGEGGTRQPDPKLRIGPYPKKPGSGMGIPRYYDESYYARIASSGAVAAQTAAAAVSGGLSGGGGSGGTGAMSRAIGGAESVAGGVQVWHVLVVLVVIVGLYLLHRAGKL